MIKIDVSVCDYLLMKSSSGLAAIIEVLQADKENGIANVAKVIVSHK